MEFLKSNIFMFLTIAGLLASGLLFIKFLIKREPVILASSITRLTIGFIAVAHVGLVSVYPFMAIGTLTLLLSDIISNLVYFSSRRFVLELQRASLLKTINSLLGKVNSLVNNPYIGYFTVDESGVIEFANEKLIELLNIGQLVGENLFSHFDSDIINRIKGKPILSMDTTLLVNGTKKRIKLTTSHTINGHRTITGSIIDYETITG